MRVPEHVPKSNKVPNKISLELVYYFLQILKHSPILLFASLSKITNRTNNEPHKWLELEYIYIYIKLSFPIRTRFPSGPSPIRNSVIEISFESIYATPCVWRPMPQGSIQKVSTWNKEEGYSLSNLRWKL